MSDAEREPISSFAGSGKTWQPVTYTFAHEWMYRDENGTHTGPIRNGEMVGGRYDGLKVFAEDEGTTP